MWWHCSRPSSLSILLILAYFAWPFSVTCAKPLFGWDQTTDYLVENLPASHNGSFISNACGGGYFSQGGTYGFACPHMMMFSEDMILASRMDGLEQRFWYATAGSNSDNDCGKCFHVRLGENERWNETDGTSVSPKRNLIVQVINSGGDVGYRQFDLFVGAGGFGVYTACNRDCQVQHCNGGPCHDHLYEGSFNVWTYSEYSADRCYGGGVKWFPPFNDTLLIDACRALIPSNGTNNTWTSLLFKDEQLFRSCYYSNRYHYHQNFASYRAMRVQCPKGMYMLTGLRRNDDTDFPLPTFEVDDETLHDTCMGSTCITTMCDCCKPSCAWTGKVSTDPHWMSVRTCDRFGFPF